MTHYSKAHKPAELMDWAEKSAHKIKKVFKGSKYRPCFAYTGMSGVASATALMIALHGLDEAFKFEMAYVRKKTEHSHGTGVELSYDIYKIREYGKSLAMVFVDDFSCTGETQRVLKSSMVSWFKARNDLVDWNISNCVWRPRFSKMVSFTGSEGYSPVYLSGTLAGVENEDVVA